MASSTPGISGEILNLLDNSSPSDIHGLEVLRIKELLEGFGYVCKPNGKLRGISGNVHDFDFVCTKLDTGEKMVLDSMITSGDNEEMLDVEMVKLRLKTYDCSPDSCIVIASRVSPSLKQMAILYRISLIEASSESSPYDRLESLLRLRDAESTRKNPLSDLA
ncbi:MAG: hypothetical protein OK457_07300 [Thaumarchaeota archaeon]|nr:hypothetical protein [Nitrososphaerota archaeon]